MSGLGNIWWSSASHILSEGDMSANCMDFELRTCFLKKQQHSSKKNFGRVTLFCTRCLVRSAPQDCHPIKVRSEYARRLLGCPPCMRDTNRSHIPRCSGSVVPSHHPLRSLGSHRPARAHHNSRMCHPQPSRVYARAARGAWPRR